MHLYHEGKVVDAGLGQPSGDDRAWIDVADRTAAALSPVVFALGWDADLVDALRAKMERATMEYRHDILHITLFAEEGGSVQQIDAAWVDHILVTVHDGPCSVLDALAQELPERPELLGSAHYLLYEVLERVADGFLERVDAHEEQFDEMEDAILAGQDRAREVFALRRTLHTLRGILADMRRVASRLARRTFPSTQSEATESSIFIDVYESLYHVMDNIDSLRDNLTGLVDLQLNQRSTKLNEIMKFLTVFSTILLPLSFITGFFGMNLRPMPELTMPHAQLYTGILMALIVAFMLYTFRRRGWF